MVQMDLTIPPGTDTDKFERLKEEEKQRFQSLQRDGTWRHIWRVVGHYSNVSIFDIASNAELHDLLTTLPLYPFMAIRVTPLCRHPSSTHADDR